MTPNPRTRTGGFTLVELLVAMVVGAVIFLASARQTVRAYEASEWNAHRSVATELAGEVLECVRAEHLGGRALTGTTCGAPAPPAGFVVATPVVTTNPPGFAAGVTRIDVTVAWTPRGGGSVTLSALVDT